MPHAHGRSVVQFAMLRSDRSHRCLVRCLVRPSDTGTIFVVTQTPTLTDTPRAARAGSAHGSATHTVASHSCPVYNKSCAHSRLDPEARSLPEAEPRPLPPRQPRPQMVLDRLKIASVVVGVARSPQREFLPERSGVARGGRGSSASAPRAKADAARARWRRWRRRGWRRPEHGAREPQPKAWRFGRRPGRRPGWCEADTGCPPPGGCSPPGWCEADTGCRGEAACGR